MLFEFASYGSPRHMIDHLQNRKDRQRWIAVGVCLASFLGLYWFLGYSAGYGVMVDGVTMFERRPLVSTIRLDYLRDDGEWGFGYFVPLAVAGLFWMRRRELLGTEVRPALWTGGAVTAIALFIYWAGYRGEQKYFGYIAGQLLVLGALLWFLGFVWFRKIFWLWMLLGMMWPWRFLIEPISNPLQLIMAKMTAGFLKIFGVGAVANGSGVSTDSIDPVDGSFIAMDIDVGCSGMRSLFALVMIGLVFAFLRVRDEWKRWLLMALVPVVAVLGNFVRMLLLYVGSLIWGTDVAIGKAHQMSPFHMVAGLVVFAVALVVMSLTVELLEKGAKFFRRRKIVRKQVVRAAT